MNSTPPGFPLWITADGEIDFDKLPIDGILKQTIDLDNFERFRSGCAVLGSMAGGGRLEAGFYDWPDRVLRFGFAEARSDS